MFPVTGMEWLQAKADGFIFGLYHWFTLGIGWVFVLGMAQRARAHYRHPGAQ